MPKGIPPHEQVMTHHRIAVHATCVACENDLFDAPTEYCQFAGIVLDWPEALCPNCGTLQFVDLGGLTRHLGAMPTYDYTSLLNRLGRLVSSGQLPSDRIVAHQKLHFHVQCQRCGYDLFGLPAEYTEYAGVVWDSCETCCPECGEVQQTNKGAMYWPMERRTIEQIFSGNLTIPAEDQATGDV